MVLAQAVERVLAGMAKMSGERFLSAEEAGDVAALGLDDPVAVVQLHRSDGSVCARLTAGVSPDADMQTPTYYFRRDQESSVLSAASGVFSRIDVFRDDILERSPEPPADPAP